MPGGRKTVSVPAVMSAGIFLHILKSYNTMKQIDKLELGKEVIYDGTSCEK